MKEEKLSLPYQSQKWEPLKVQKTYSENFSHVLDHEWLYYFCYWERRRIGKKPIIQIPGFVVGWN